MSRRRALTVGIVLVVLCLGLSVWAYPHLPSRVPTHWDSSGHVNGYSSRISATFLMPSILFVVWLLMAVLPVVSPRGFRIDQFGGAFYASCLAIIGVLLVTKVLILRTQLGMAGSPGSLLMIPVGALLAILGNFMGKFRRNFFIGIRTPWTLASDEVWLRTNRLAGELMVVGGVAIMACSFNLSLCVGVVLGVVAVVVVVPIAYSFILYTKVEGFGPNGSSELNGG